MHGVYVCVRVVALLIAVVGRVFMDIVLLPPPPLPLPHLSFTPKDGGSNVGEFEIYACLTRPRVVV